MPDVCLIVMTRAPISGETKTRLIPALGADGAARFHAACLADLLGEAEVWRRDLAGRGMSLSLTLSITPPGSEDAFSRWGVEFPGYATVAAQRGDSLGERMIAALRDGLASSGRVLLNGCDLPLLTGAHWEAAIQALDRCDAVIGPSTDGGYYLIGVRRPERAGWEGLLEPGAWSNDTVLARTLARARDLDLRVGQIATLPDVDVPDDAQRVLAHPLARILAARRGVTMLRDHFGR